MLTVIPINWEAGIGSLLESDSRKIYIEKCCLMEPCIKYCISGEVDGQRHSLLIRNWGKLPLYLWFHCYHQRAREVHSDFVMNRGDCNNRGNCKPCRQGGVRIERMIWWKKSKTRLSYKSQFQNISRNITLSKQTKNRMTTKTASKINNQEINWFWINL